MSTAQYAVGLGFFAGTVGAVLVSAGLVLHRNLPELRGAPGLLAFSVLGTAGLAAVHLLPGAFGVLTRGTVLGCSVALLAATIALTRRGRASDPVDTTVVPASGTWSWLIATVSVTAVAVAVLGSLDKYIASPAESVDALNSHLPYVAEWIQAGNLWHVDHFTPGLPSEYIPSNNGIVFLSVMLPWRSDFLVRASLLPFLGLTAVAAYAIGVELGAPRATAITFASALLTIPTVIRTALLDTLPEPILTASFGAGVLFLLRHARTRERSDLIVAGIALGLAFGSKWTGASSVAVVLLICLCAWLFARVGYRHVARGATVVVGLVALTGGFWLLRNLVVTGNPVFPLRFAAFGVEILNGPQDVVTEQIGWSIASHVDDPALWRPFILLSWWNSFGIPGLLLALGTAGAGLLSLKRWRHEVRLSGDTARRLAAAAAVAALFGVYLVTPYTAFGPEDEPSLVWVTTRYFSPGLVLAAGLTAWAVGALGRARIVGELAAVLALLLALDSHVGLPGPNDLPGATTALVAGLLLGWSVLAAVGTQARDRLRHRMRTQARLGVATGSAAAALVISAAVAGHQLENRFSAGRFAKVDRVFDWINHNARAHQRIGLAGHWSTDGISPVFPSYGPSYRNDVTYIGPVRRHMLREYGRASQFVPAVQGAKLDLLIVGHEPVQVFGLPPDPSVLPWARSAGFEPVAASRRLTLLRRTQNSRHARRDRVGPAAASKPTRKAD